MATPQDDLFAEYMQHLNSFGSGNKPYASPQTTTVPLSPQGGGVLGTCKTSSAGGMPHPGGACLVTCSSIGS